MNNNIFIKNKNQNKFNPDILKKYSDLSTNRNQRKFEFLNKPYKVIIKDKVPEKITSQNDLKINMNENNVDIKKNFDTLVNDRNYLDNENKEKFSKKNYNLNRNRFDFRNYQVNKVSQESNDYQSLKKNNKTYYKKESNSLMQEKSKYNDIMNNLKKQGII